MPVVLEALSEMESVEMVTMSNALFNGSLYEDISDNNDTICELARGGTLSHFECVACNISGRLPPCLFDEDSRISILSLGTARHPFEIMMTSLEWCRPQ